MNYFKEKILALSSFRSDHTLFVSTERNSKTRLHYIKFVESFEKFTQVRHTLILKIRGNSIRAVFPLYHVSSCINCYPSNWSCLIKWKCHNYTFTPLVIYRSSAWELASVCSHKTSVHFAFRKPLLWQTSSWYPYSLGTGYSQSVQSVFLQLAIKTSRLTKEIRNVAFESL